MNFYTIHSTGKLTLEELGESEANIADFQREHGLGSYDPVPETLATLAVLTFGDKIKLKKVEE